MERKIFEKDVNGKKIRCEVIATYEDNNTHKKYIVYTDGVNKDTEKLKLIYSLYEIENDMIKLIPVISEEDIKIGEELVKSILSDLV